MAGVMPSVSGGVSPFELAQIYNNAQTRYNASLAEQARKANQARQEAITADTEAQANMNIAGMSNIEAIRDVAGPTAVMSTLTGQLGRSVMNPDVPSGLDAAFASQAAQQFLQTQQADELNKLGGAMSSFFESGLRPGDLANRLGIPMEELPLGESFDTRYSQGDSKVPFRTITGRQGDQVTYGPTMFIDPDQAIALHAQGLGDYAYGSTQQPPPQATTVVPGAGTAPMPQPQPQPAPAPQAQPAPAPQPAPVAPDVSDVMAPAPVASPEQNIQRFQAARPDVEIRFDGTNYMIKSPRGTWESIPPEQFDEFMGYVEEDARGGGTSQ